MAYEPRSFQQFAGLCCYYDTGNWTCIEMTWHETYGRVIDVVNTDLGRSESVYEEHPAPVPDHAEYVYFKVSADGIRYRYFYSFDGAEWTAVPRIFDSARLSDEYIAAAQGVAFTGAFVGMFNVDGQGTRIPADFDYFRYRETDDLSTR